MGSRLTVAPGFPPSREALPPSRDASARLAAAFGVGGRRGRAVALAEANSRTEHDEFQFIRHPRARRYVIRVRPDGSVRVTLPRWGSRRQAQDFAEQQRPWIERQRRRIAEQKENGVRHTPGVLKELRGRAARELPDQLLRLAAQHGLKVSQVSIRNQRSRWGSCSPNGHICLNWRLVLLPDFVRTYVLIHELMHLKRLDHSPRFWKLVAEACPEYEVARRWLRKRLCIEDFRIVD